MGDNVAEARRRNGGRLMWTDKMKSDLLESKSNAMLLTKSSDPPRTETGRKKG